MGASLRSAGQLSLKRLYHYQDFDLSSRDDHVGWLTDILRNHRVWCSSPATFNDPWDGKPYFDPASLDDAETRAATAEALISTRTGGPELNGIDERLRTDHEFLKAAIHDFSVQMFSFVARRWGVYCVCPDPCLTLMWSHYARDHKGICLEFAVADTKFQGAMQVQYASDYPPFLLHEPDSYLRMLLVKSDDWRHENEFRLICPRFTDVKDSPFVMDGDYLQIGSGALEGIILGCQIDGDACRKVQELVNDYAPSVRVRRVQRALNRYRLILVG